MGLAVIIVLCSLAGIIQGEVFLKADRPYLRVSVFDSADLHCCYEGMQEDLTWVRRVKEDRNITTLRNQIASKRLTTKMTSGADRTVCGTLTFTSLLLNDSGLYQCWLNASKHFTHGTYLHVYKPLERTIDIKESTKNKILTAEGILLLLCVLVPSATLLFKSRTISELEKKKMKKEEENIYQGLNLDDCCATYDQIERSQAQGPYEDVANIMEEGEDVQLEKP